MTAILEQIDNIVWGIPSIVLIMGVGILLTIKLRVLQFRKLGKALHYMWNNEEEGVGEVSSFGALCTSLAATIGTGNIVGVATAVMAGGPGAIFWMVLAAVFGMATKYAEGLLAIKYRQFDEKTGHVLGGPFLYIENGMGQKWKWLAKAFAFFGVCAAIGGTGTFAQVSGITSAANTLFDPNNKYIAFSLGNQSYSWAVVISAIIVALCTALVVIGGIKRIASITTVVVPFMAIIYIISCLSILIYNFNKVPSALLLIIQSAFGLKAMAGGALGAMIAAMQKGIARGIFSNEAGLGTAPIAVAAAQTKEPVRQGLVCMTGTFIDTILICTMTGTTLILTGAYQQGLEGVNVTIYAFSNGLPWSDKIGALILLLSLAMFAFTTILGWDYYSEACLEYLSKGNKKLIITYRWFYILAVLIGPFLTISAIWTTADIFNGLMAIPNLIAILALNGVVVSETKNYFDRLNSGKIKEFKSK